MHSSSFGEERRDHFVHFLNSSNVFKALVTQSKGDKGEQKYYLLFGQVYLLLNTRQQCGGLRCNRFTL